MENIEAMLCAYIEGDLDASGKSQIEKHLKDHPQHRKLLEELLSMRQLVRDLPRVEAPIDLEDSLRQKVERSMLLEDSVVAAPRRQRADWWPQFFTIAAIFLLFASLCFILCRTLLPTLKPAVFLQNSNDNVSMAAPGNRMSTPDSALVVPQTQPSPVSNSIAASSAAPTALAPQTNTILQSTQQFVVQSQQQMRSTAQLDLQSIRRRLENSGFGVSGAARGSGSPSVLMVVNSTDPPATNAQITQFLSNNTGISWKAVPSDAEIKNGPTTLPTGIAMRAQLTEAQKNILEKPLDQTSVSSTQPSNLYVARGFTPQQADALRLSLTVPQNGPEVKVTIYPSAQPLATTQPTILNAKEDDALWMRDLASPPTSQPAEAANSAADLNGNPTTAPSAPGGAADSQNASGIIMANNNAALPLAQNKSQILLPVDAVIVLQPGTVAVNPTTQPATPKLLTVPASTQP